MKSFDDKFFNVTVFFKYSNYFLILAIMSAYAIIGGTKFVDVKTVFLACLLSMQNIFALKAIEKKFDPFVLIISFYLTFFYVFRIFTLIIFDFSFVLERFSFGYKNSNDFLLLILASNFVIYFALGLNNISQPLNLVTKQRKDFTIVKIYVLYGLALISLWASIYSNYRLVGLILNFIDPLIILMGLLIADIIFRRFLTFHSFLITSILILLVFIEKTFLGSKGYILHIFQLIAIIFLACFSGSQITKRALNTLLIASVFIAPISLKIFNDNFLARVAHSSDLNSSTQEHNNFAKRINPINLSGAKNIAPMFFARLGYFDFGAEIFAHKKEYQSIFNFNFYAKSIVDNLLTPGFDLFDTPKVTNSLVFYYGFIGIPSKIYITPDNYQSDQIDIYSEFYSLFGSLFFIPLFITTYFFKVFYSNIKDLMPLSAALKRFYVLLVFQAVFVSAGLDLTIVYAFTTGLSLLALVKFFKKSP